MTGLRASVRTCLETLVELVQEGDLSRRVESGYATREEIGCHHISLPLLFLFWIHSEFTPSNAHTPLLSQPFRPA